MNFRRSSLPLNLHKVNPKEKEPTRAMCGIVVTLLLGRHNNGPVEERTNVGVRGSAVNTRVVKLLPLSKDQGDTGKSGGSENHRADVEMRPRMDAPPKQESATREMN
jgi:hypothetical protein